MQTLALRPPSRIANRVFDLPAFLGYNFITYD